MVVKPVRIQPACRVPTPVRGHGVHEARDDGGVDDVSGEVAALGERAGDEGGGDGREDELEEPLREHRVGQASPEEVREADETASRVAPTKKTEFDSYEIFVSFWNKYVIGYSLTELDRNF